MDKTPVGKRLALSARQFAYQEDVVAVGPQPTTAIVAEQGGRLVLSFDPATVGPDGLLLRLSGPVRQVQCERDLKLNMRPGACREETAKLV